MKEKAKQSFEGLESYEIGYKKGFEKGVNTTMSIIDAWLDTAYKITVDKEEFYKFMKNTFELNGGTNYDKSREKKEGFCEGTEEAEVSRTAL